MCARMLAACFVTWVYPNVNMHRFSFVAPAGLCSECIHVFRNGYAWFGHEVALVLSLMCFHVVFKHVPFKLFRCVDACLDTCLLLACFQI